MGKNVLVIHNSFDGEFGFGPNWNKMDSLALPLGLTYISENLRDNDFSVSFLDFNVDRVSKSDFLDYVGEQDFVLMSIYSDSLGNAREVISKIREVNSNVKIVCGGPYCTLIREYIEGADIVFVGEAEEVISDLLTKINSGESLDEFEGLIYRNNDGEIIENPGITYVRNLDRVDRAMHPVDKKYGNFLGVEVSGIAGVMTSRGCPHRCIYCTHRGAVPYRKRSVGNVISELSELEKMGMKYVIFYDDNLLMDKKRVISIMDEIINSGIKLKIIVQGRVDSADLDFYKKLRLAGVIMIMFGIENANQKVLDYYNKKIKIEDIKRAVDITNKVGMIVFGWFMIGSELEGREEFEENKAFLKEIRIDWLNINILGYYKGSKLWEDSADKGLIDRDEIKVYANKKLSPFSYQEQLELKEELLGVFYKQPMRIGRLLSKTAKLGIMGVIAKIIFNKSFLKKIKNPFASVEDEIVRS
ncbi:B12-binding domain-containing radical SAM protein [Patescibacteria group bacterium]